VEFVVVDLSTSLNSPPVTLSVSFMRVDAVLTSLRVHTAAAVLERLIVLVVFKFGLLLSLNDLCSPHVGLTYTTSEMYLTFISNILLPSNNATQNGKFCMAATSVSIGRLHEVWNDEDLKFVRRRSETSFVTYDLLKKYMWKQRFGL